METTQEKIDAWALVEIMGHEKAAGRVTTMPFGNTVMLRVDIPETEISPAFTKLYGMSSIFSLTLVDEQTAKLHAESYKISPIVSYDVREQMNKHFNKAVNAAVENYKDVDEIPENFDFEDFDKGW